MKKEDIHDELAGLSPLLGQLKKKGDGMSAPPDYFNSLNEKVMQRLEAEGEKRMAPPAPFWGVSVNRIRMAAAAAVFALLLTAWWWMRPVQQAQEVATVVPEVTGVDTLTQEDAEAYIQENILSFDTEMLAAEFGDDDAAEKSPTSNNPDAAATHPNSAELDAVLDALTEEELQDLL